MTVGKTSSLQKGTRIVLFLLVWTVTAWLLYPLLVLDNVDMENVKNYFYRSAAGIIIMILMFGKTVIDLLFPPNLSPRKSFVYVSFLTLYTITLAVGVIFLVLRILVVYLKNNPIGTSTHWNPRAEARGMRRVNTERRFLPRFKNRGLAPSNVSTF